MTIPAKRLYLIDGSSYIYRAYYAIRHLSNSKGEATNAVFGFTKMLMKVVKDEQPDALAVIFDAKGPTFRKEIYPEYKANRSAMPEDLRPQIPVIKEVVRGFRMPGLELAGYEADDIIATLARKFEAQGMDVTIVTGDKDLMQVVSDRVRLLDTMKDKFFGIAEVMERFGVPPEQVVEVLGLAGDTSDNVPGVPGIGEKTASSLIQEFGTIENLLVNIDKVKGKKRQENLREFGDQALLSRRLVDLVYDLDLNPTLDELTLSEPDNEALTRIFKEMDFHKLVKDFSVERRSSGEGYRCILTREDFQLLLRDLRQAGRFAFDTETTSLNPLQADLVGLSFCVREGEAVYIPVGHSYLGVPDQLPLAEVLEGLRPLLEDSAIGKIGQNIKYDALVLRRAGVVLRGIDFDTMIASYLLHPGASSHSMDAMASEHLQHKTISYAEMTGSGKKQICFSQVEIEKATVYAAEDADITLRLERLFAPQLQGEVKSLFSEVEMPLLEVLVQMAWDGILLDDALLGRISEELSEKIAVLQSSIYALAGEEFNINSPKQMGEILFDRLGLPKGKKTKTGWSTDVKVLTELALEHEIAAKILEYRSLAKLRSTYTDALPKLMEPATGRIHTSFNQAVTATGRLSSSDPNLQNIPIRTEEGRRIREAFVPAEGCLLLCADYSQIELRVMAHLASEPALQQSFAAGEDIHRRTAGEIFGLFPELVSEEQRRRAKTINFGVLYGMGAFSLARELGISNKEAKGFIQRYFERYPRVLEFMEQLKAQAKELGYVTTLLGRRCAVAEIQSSNGAVRGFGERNAVNYPIQGSSADIIKVAMVRIARCLQAQGLRSRMLLQVHDELVFEVPLDEVETMRELVRQEMEGACELSVPLKVEMGTGANWREAH